jgi:preprotein translocase subunit SecF
MRILQHANFPFVQSRFVVYIIAGILLLASIVGLITFGLNWSTDFTGGVSAVINMTPKDPGVPPLNIDELRKVVNDGGFEEAEIQYIGAQSNASFQIKVKGSDANATKNKLIEVISSKLPQYTQGRDLQNDVLREISMVGARAGSEMRTNVIIAVAIALLLMIIYIWIRFEFTFGLMAIVALFFNVMVVVGVFAFTGKEVTMQIIAALLTIVGYAINDTIVVFDRIREDLKIYRKDPVPVIFNRAMNSTLSRTIITGGSTLLTALALYFFGGPVIHDFSLAIFLGIIIGTLSSIFIASNLVLDTIKATHQERQSIKHLTKK